MLYPERRPQGEYPYIGHPTPVKLDRFTLKAFSEADELVSTLAAHASERAHEDYRRNCGPGPTRELLALVAHPALTDVEWQVVSEGVGNWGRSQIKRERGGIEVLATRISTNAEQISEPVALQGKFLVVNCSGYALHVCAGDESSPSTPALTSTLMKPLEVAEQWQRRGGNSEWIVVLLPPAPDDGEFTHTTWGKLRRSIIEELSLRGGTSALKLALVPLPLL